MLLLEFEFGMLTHKIYRILENGTLILEAMSSYENIADTLVSLANEFNINIVYYHCPTEQLQQIIKTVDLNFIKIWEEKLKWLNI